MRPAAFEAMVCKVGVFRRSNVKPLGPMVLWVLDRFARFYKKSPEALLRNASGDFFDSSQIVVCVKGGTVRTSGSISCFQIALSQGGKGSI